MRIPWAVELEWELVHMLFAFLDAVKPGELVPLFHVERNVHGVPRRDVDSVERRDRNVGLVINKDLEAGKSRGAEFWGARFDAFVALDVEYELEGVSGT